MYYKCFQCGRKVDREEYAKTKVRCPYCGSKILFKDRKIVTKVIAR